MQTVSLDLRPRLAIYKSLDARGAPRERPKLNLLPRTIPRETETPTKLADGAVLPEDIEKEKIPEKVVAKPVPAEKVFGAAKPVDTAAKYVFTNLPPNTQMENLRK